MSDLQKSSNESTQNNYNLPWVEKYRPLKLDDVKGQNKIVESLKNIIENGSFPHLLFYGGSGFGKTSVILSVIDQYFGKKKKLMVMRLDASDDRGINSVRDEIKAFAEKKNYFQSGIKVIILDEADSMTFDAQFALRRIIEKYSSNTRFCLICNYENKIIPAMKSFFTDRKILICREISKYYEEYIRQPVDKLEKFKIQPKGELTIVLSEKKNDKINSQKLSESDRVIIKKMINKLSNKEITEIISKNKKVSKKEIYNYCLKLKK